MNPFELFAQLPAWLIVYHEGERYEMSPDLRCIGGQAWLGYVGQGKFLLLAERLDTQDELETMVTEWGQRLNRNGTYHASTLFDA